MNRVVDGVPVFQGQLLDCRLPGGLKHGKHFRPFRRLRTQMLRASSIPMTRKVLALVVVLITSSLAPATAVIGFCAQMPCCFGEALHGAALAANDAGCCTTIRCYEAPSPELTVTAEAKSITTGTAPLLAVVAAAPAVHAARSAFDDSSPPPTTKQRLSSLSVLLI